jgi:hypothetical protein
MSWTDMDGQHPLVYKADCNIITVTITGPSHPSLSLLGAGAMTKAIASV